MEKRTWQKIDIDRNTKEPSPRWGHCAVRLQQEIVFFGGYADTNYMNDLWSFDTVTMTWQEHKTTGAVPSARSNCTLHYDQNSNSVLLCGGGGSNKRRFNTISLLDWATKVWTEIEPNENEKAPWERTYHSSQILYPYLIVFGGEGIADLDDLWVFNLQTRKWTQIATSRDKPSPCARRFHTSVLLNNDFYVIAGCHGKYRCLSDIWKINLSTLIATGRTQELQWQEIKPKGSSFLTRWGHTSVVFDQKIYVFGGRFSNDLQDILVIDPMRNQIRTLKVSGEVPKARRRHSAVFSGSSMIIFGGFNGEYFNDMSYINVFDSRPRQEISDISTELQLIKWVGREEMSDGSIVSTSGKEIKIHKGLMVSKLKTQGHLEQFLEFIQGKFTYEELQQIIEIIYLGTGKLPQEITDHFEIELFDTSTERNNHARKIIDPDQVELGTLVSRKKNWEVIVLEQEKYAAYLERYHQSQFYDLLVVFGEKECIPVNKTLLAVSSQYFASMLKNHKEECLEIKNCQDFGDIRVFQVLLNYLQSGYLVVPQGLDETCWMLLYHIAEYLCLSSLMNQCQNQLIALLSLKNCQSMLDYSSKHRLDNLALHSGELLFRQMLEQGKKSQLSCLKLKKQKSSSEHILAGLIQTVEFDLRQQERREGRQGVQISKRRNADNAEKENEIEYGQE